MILDRASTLQSVPTRQPFLTDTEILPDVSPPCEGGYLLCIHPLKINAGLIPLQDAQLIAGREESCQLFLPDSSVSRRHAVIWPVADQVFIKDCSSTNGTSVNEVPVRDRQMRLHAGDRITIGSYVFKYLAPNDIETRYHKAAFAMMTRDTLTGILNQNSFLENIDHEISRSLRRDATLSLVLFDIDNFKSINENYGYEAGDEVLRGVCERLCETTRAEDFVGRYGGEEFGVLLPEEPIHGAITLAERLRSVIADEPFRTSDGHVATSISLGVASLDEVAVANPVRRKPGRQADQRGVLRHRFLQLCEERLSRAKQTGFDHNVSD